MQEAQIIDTAGHHFEELTSWHIKVKKFVGSIEKIDGEITLSHPKTKEKLTLLLEIKNELRNNDLHTLFQQKNKYAGFLVMAQYISKPIREQLKNNKINYLESSGNCYIEHDSVFIFIDNQKVLAQRQTSNSKMYTESGMRFIYTCFLNPLILNATYREIANEAEIALGNVGAIIEALENEDIIQTRNNSRKINNASALFDIWANDYETAIRPKLFQRYLSFSDKNMRVNWKNIPLHNSFWGGEPAANLMDNYLIPEKFVLYSTLNLQQLMKEYKLMPSDKEGEIIYMKPLLERKHLPDKADPFLIYAELILSKDSRCHEAAQRIKQKYIDPALRNI